MREKARLRIKSSLRFAGAILCFLGVVALVVLIVGGVKFSDQNELLTTPYIYLGIILPIPIGILLWMVAKDLNDSTQQHSISQQQRPYPAKGVVSPSQAIIRAIPYTGPNTNKFCIISKTALTPEKAILQCPFCGALFIEEYLVSWLQMEENCPVCQRKLHWEE